MSGEGEPPLSEIATKLEVNRITLSLGFPPAEMLGATEEEWRQWTILYRTLFRWIQEKGYRLTSDEIKEVEALVTKHNQGC